MTSQPVHTPLPTPVHRARDMGLVSLCARKSDGRNPRTRYLLPIGRMICVRSLRRWGIRTFNVGKLKDSVVDLKKCFINSESC